MGGMAVRLTQIGVALPPEITINKYFDGLAAQKCKLASHRRILCSQT
jgi:hypothetical protein